MGTAHTDIAAPVVLVTGGARRVGKAIAEDLANHGWPVVIHANAAASAAQNLADSLIGRGARAAAIAGDLTDSDGLKALADAAAKPFGPVQVLINNASVFEDDSAVAPDFDAFDRHFAVHVKAPTGLAAAMANALPEGAEGLIVNIIDQRVWALNPRFFSYTLSKSALWTATRTMAQAFAPRLRVNAIGPGPTLANERQEQGDFDKQVGGLILRRGPELGEFGATIRYLWEARSVTGQMIALDGGQHLAWETPDVAGIRE